MTWFNLIPETQKNRIYDIYGINILPEPEPDIQSNGKFFNNYNLKIKVLFINLI